MRQHLKRACDGLDVRLSKLICALLSQHLEPASGAGVDLDEVRSVFWIENEVDSGLNGSDCLGHRVQRPRDLGTGIVHSVQHLRIENRVLPAGPTVIDCAANVALYYGLLAGLADTQAPVWPEMSFTAAEDNFFAAARGSLE